jgi:HSP20 family protein
MDLFWRSDAARASWNSGERNADMTMHAERTETSTAARTDTSTPGRWEPTTELNRLAEQLSELIDGQWLPGVPEAQPSFIPRADLEETDDAYVFDVELPGMKKKDITIETDGRRILISGERKETKRVGLLRRQTRSWGQFRYEVVLPDEVDGDNIEATMNDGVLHLNVPKKVSTQQRKRIQVK